MVFIVVVLCSIWILFVLLIWWGNIRLRPKYVFSEFKDEQTDSKPICSVVIAVRNEAQNIGHLLDCLTKQTIGVDTFEVIIIDDGSTDETSTFALSYANKLQLQLQSNPGKGKKQAINFGVKNAKTPYILCTDADVTLGNRWVEEHIQSLLAGAILCAGPVRVQGNGWGGQLQSIEFLSTLGVTSGLWGIGIKGLCYGANISYSREAYLQVSDKMGGNDLASGDDVFLLQAMVTLGLPVVYLQNSEAVVTTYGFTSVRQFFNQRLRWSSKWSSYPDSRISVIAFLVFLTQLSFVVSPFLLNTSWLFSFWGIKAIAEYLLLKMMSKIAQQPFWFLSFMFWVLFYPLFAVFMGIWANLKPSYIWKGRTTK